MSVYCVLGAKGQTGRLLVEKLVRKVGVKEVRCVVRDVERVPEGTFPADEDKINVIAGDVGKHDDKGVRRALEGAHGIFFVCAAKGYERVKACDYRGVGHVAKLAKECKCARFLLLSSQLVHPTNQYNFVRGILNTINTGLFHWSGMMDFKFAGEKLLRISGVDYTIVRPGQLLDGDGGKSSFHVAQTNGSFMRTGITRNDLASLLIAAIDSPRTKNCTFEVACTPCSNEDACRPSDDLFASLDETYDNGWGADGRDVTKWEAESNLPVSAGVQVEYVS
jgi:uncharacterized protein YbjT (DUF2867 family)